MARYCVIADNRNLQQIKEEVSKIGGGGQREAKYPSGPSASGDSPVESIQGFVFAELTDAQVEALRQKGFKVKSVQKTKSEALLNNPLTPNQLLPTPPVIPSKAVYDANAAIIYSRWAEFRNLFTPPLTGQGLVCAVFGSGIRKTHRALAGKVVYERNFSDSPTCDDIFDHDTGTAYLIAGGELSEAEQSGLSPGALLWNIKCLNDEGEGTTEDLILAMAHVQALYEWAIGPEGVPVGDPMHVNAVNISLGCEDDGDPDNPLRIATEKLYHSSPGRFGIFAAAGNEPTYCLLPAAHEHCWAVGSASLVPFKLSDFSARGSKTGLIKPEVIMFGENLLVASSKSDDAFIVKSGTSFSCPLCLGILCLVREAADRLGQLENILYVKYENLEPYVAAMCLKPTGQALIKEDGVGYGLPMGNLFAQEWQGAGINVQQMMETMVPAMVMMMGMGMMVKSMD